MGAETWSLMVKLCDSCKRESALLPRRHGVLLRDLRLQDPRSQQARVVPSAGPSLYEVCEQAPASFTCKVDAIALCVTSDRDFHSANPLACRYECLSVVPFYDSAADAKSHGSAI
nr:zinc finger protein CONSTANS-LIKE 4-like [Ipomoea batatas]